MNIIGHNRYTEMTSKSLVYPGRRSSYGLAAWERASILIIHIAEFKYYGSGTDGTDDAVDM